MHSAQPASEGTATDADLPPLIATPPGRYRHYKGGLYDVIGTVRHSETLEPLTLYRALYGAHGLWVRPAAMFAQEVEIDGVRQPRFARLEGDGGDAATDAGVESTHGTGVTEGVAGERGSVPLPNAPQSADL